MPVEGSDEQKRTNEIGMAIPLLDGCEIVGRDITGDALLTQRPLASYTRLVFDYLRMTQNSLTGARGL